MPGNWNVAAVALLHPYKLFRNEESAPIGDIWENAATACYLLHEPTAPRPGWPLSASTTYPDELLVAARPNRRGGHARSKHNAWLLHQLVWPGFMSDQRKTVAIFHVGGTVVSVAWVAQPSPAPQLGLGMARVNAGLSSGDAIPWGVGRAKESNRSRGCFMRSRRGANGRDHSVTSADSRCTTAIALLRCSKVTLAFCARSVPTGTRRSSRGQSSTSTLRGTSAAWIWAALPSTSS